MGVKRQNTKQKKTGVIHMFNKKVVFKIYLKKKPNQKPCQSIREGLTKQKSWQKTYIEIPQKRISK